MTAPGSVTLPRREHQVVLQILEGKSAKQAGAALGLSPRTIEVYKYKAMEKLGVSNIVELVKYGIRAGWITV